MNYNCSHPGEIVLLHSGEVAEQSDEVDNNMTPDSDIQMRRYFLHSVEVVLLTFRSGSTVNARMRLYF